jgi:hypothetical protein
LALAALLFAGAPAGRSDAGIATPTESATAAETATETPTATPTTTQTPGAFSLALDCDPAALGVQDACDVAVSIGHADVDVVFRNGTAAPVDVAAFNFKVRDPDRTRIVPPPGNAQSVDGNPDLNQRAFTPGWACPGPSPLNDTGEDGPGTAVSFIACFAPPELAVTVPAGTELTLATVHYDVPAGAPVGPVTLTPSFVAIFDAAFAELGSCDPIYANPLPCSAAVLTLQPPPPTSTRTPTPTATATATPTPPGAIFSLVPAGNAMNVDSATGAANLWLCAVPALCDGPGEGALDVIAHAANAHTIDADGDEIEDGVASYFIDVLIDTPLADLSACDLAFSPGGVGEARGYVRQASGAPCGANPAPLNGACSITVGPGFQFRCYTGGSALGPAGEFDAAQLHLEAAPAARSVLYPGVQNGFVATIYSPHCGMLDPGGRPVLDASPAGLLSSCGQAAVSVRILEGDMNLDCRVDVIDDQMMAFRYGATYPSALYDAWYDVEPQGHDLDIDAGDLQRVFGRNGSTCQAPIPAQPPDPGS